MVLASTVWGASMLLLAVCVAGAIGLRSCRLVLRSPTATSLKWEAVGQIERQVSGGRLSTWCAPRRTTASPSSNESATTAGPSRMWRGPIRGLLALPILLTLWSPDAPAQTVVQCSESPCAVTIQLDLTQAIAQFTDAIPEWSELQPLYWACVSLLLVGFTVRAAVRTLE